jgi:choline monooxygenase
MINKETFSNLAKSDLSIEPLERAETIPSRWYTDPRFYELEKECVFARTWQGIGHLGQVQAPGDFFLAAIAGNPIIVVRGKDEQLRAFYNVCRHRGGPLATKDGNTTVLQCQYHGWTYLLDGSLRGVPHFDRVELFDRKDFGLVAVEVDCWEGLVFVRLAPAEVALSACVEGIIERIAPMRLETKTFCRRVEYQVNCNWKVYMDNYLEGYHVPYVHPELCKLYDYRNYTTEGHCYYSLQHSPLSGDENIYAKSEGEAYYYCVFPNFMLNILPGRLQTNLVLPLAYNRTLVIFQYYYDDVSSPAALKMIEDDLKYSDRIQQEDIEICEHVQKGLESRAYDRGRFSVKFEEGVYLFQNLLKAAYKSWIDESTNDAKNRSTKDTKNTSTKNRRKTG